MTTPEGSFMEQLKALASGMEIIQVLAAHKPTPVPVTAIAATLGAKRSTVSMHLAKLRKNRLVSMESRRKGYIADSTHIKAVIGETNYAGITQGFLSRNEDTPGQSQD